MTVQSGENVFRPIKRTGYICDDQMVWQRVPTYLVCAGCGVSAFRFTSAGDARVLLSRFWGCVSTYNGPALDFHML